jgi:hypothetical protein
MNRFFRTEKTIRFRRWSRAGYAVFRSLHNCVSIGFLKNVIADSSLQKSNAVAQKSLNTIVAFDDNSECDDVLFLDNCVINNLLLQSRLVIAAEQRNEYAQRISVTYYI